MTSDSPARPRPLDATAVERSAIRRISIRLVPFLVLSYLVSYIDRSNVGFAALQMNDDIGLTAATFGLASSVFFLAYVLLEVPSNGAMARFGARVWLARIMITWGIIATCMVFVVGPTSFTVLRVLLGAAEAGFFPGVVLYLTFWYPAAYRARVLAVFSMAIPLASVLGSPVSGHLLALDGTWGLRGWQWLFIVEGFPAVVLGVLAFFVLPDGPAKAAWLPQQEKEWLAQELERADSGPTTSRTPLRDVLLSRNILILALVYASTAAISQGLSLWQPQMISSFGLSDGTVGWLNAVPFAVAIVGMLVWGRVSDHLNRGLLTAVLPIALAAVALAFVPLATSPAIFLLVMSAVLVGTYAAKGPFWSLATAWMSRREAILGVAVINALGSLAAFGGNWVIGAIKDATESFAWSLLPLTLLAVVSVLALLAASARREAALRKSRATAH